MKRMLPLLTLLCLLASCSLPVLWETAAPAEETPEADTLEVRFLDVGQADAALVLCGGQTMLIDGGNVDDSSFLYAYLKEQGIGHLDYVVNTHPHEDHVGGLTGALHACTAGTALACTEEYEGKAFQNFKRALEEQGVPITVPRPDDTFALGSAAVTVLGPRGEHEDWNDRSLVLRVDFGATSFLFTGDCGREEEQELLEAGCDLSADVLKVGHHGSADSTTYPFLREVMPRYAVISVGEGNDYGHPSENTLSRLRDAGAEVWRTDLAGTVTAVSDGKTVTLQPQRGGEPEPPAESAAAEGYIGNRRSMVFHLPTCSGLPAEQNRVTLATRGEALAEGYRPCGICHP